MRIAFRIDDVNVTCAHAAQMCNPITLLFFFVPVPCTVPRITQIWCVTVDYATHKNRETSLCFPGLGQTTPDFFFIGLNLTRLAQFYPCSLLTNEGYSQLHALYVLFYKLETKFMSMMCMMGCSCQHRYTPRGLDYSIYGVSYIMMFLFCLYIYFRLNTGL